MRELMRKKGDAHGRIVWRENSFATRQRIGRLCSGSGFSSMIATETGVERQADDDQAGRESQVRRLEIAVGEAAEQPRGSILPTCGREPMQLQHEPDDDRRGNQRDAEPDDDQNLRRQIGPRDEPPRENP